MTSADDNLAANLRRLMAGKYNYKTLGAAAGLSPNTIKNYCTEGRAGSAKLSDLEKLAKPLKVAVLSLLADHADQPDEFQATVDPVQLSLLRNLDDLPVLRQSQLWDLIKIEADAAREAHAHLEKKKAAKPKATESALAVGPASHKMEMRVRRGDGNVMQDSFPLRTVADPFKAKPGARESRLYGQIEKAPKGPPK